MRSRVPDRRTFCVSLVAALSLSGAACADTEPEPTAEQELEDSEILEDPEVVETADGDGVDETAAFFDDPASVVGEEVTVGAEVAEVVDPNGFRIQARDPSGERFLVVHDGTASLAQGDMVEVTGTVMEFNMSQVENEMGLDLEKDRYEVYEGEYGITADTIEVQSE